MHLVSLRKSGVTDEVIIRNLLLHLADSARTLHKHLPAS
jgi:hypothetical protein